MEVEGLDREAEGLAAEVVGSGRGELGKLWRCPAGLRSRIVLYAQRRQADGERVAEIAGRLGLAERTLRRWLRRERGEETAVGFRPVSIVPVAAGPGDCLGASAELTLVTPGGYRVEGLDVEAAAYLLRVLG